MWNLQHQGQLDMCVCVLRLDEHRRLLKGGTLQSIRTKPSNLLATANNQLGTCTLISAFAMLISQRDNCNCVLLWGTALLSCSLRDKKKMLLFVSLGLILTSFKSLLTDQTITSHTGYNTDSHEATRG